MALAFPSPHHLTECSSQLCAQTSRDGVHIDHEWVYAHRPLIPKDGLTQSDWDSGLIMQSAQLMTRENEHRTYFEARRGDIHHENRFGEPDEPSESTANTAWNVAKIGTASWELDRIVGLRTAHPDAVGIVTTKRFRLIRGSLRLNVDVPSDDCGSQILVEVLLAGDSDGAAPSTVALDLSAPIESFSGNIEAHWNGLKLGQALAVHDVIQLRFHMHGAAKLYAFQVVPLPPAPPSPLPSPPLPTPLTPSPSPEQPSPPSSSLPAPTSSPPSPLSTSLPLSSPSIAQQVDVTTERFSVGVGLLIILAIGFLVHKCYRALCLPGGAAEIMPSTPKNARAGQDVEIATPSENWDDSSTGIADPVTLDDIKSPQSTQGSRGSCTQMKLKRPKLKPGGRRKSRYAQFEDEDEGVALGATRAWGEHEDQGEPPPRQVD